jgi:hypothetical protein
MRSARHVPNRIFLIGFGIAVLSAFFLVAILPYTIWYYSQDNDDYSFDWCYECSGLSFRFGPELSIVMSIVFSMTLAVGIIIILRRGHTTL